MVEQIVVPVEGAVVVRGDVPGLLSLGLPVERSFVGHRQSGVVVDIDRGGFRAVWSVHGFPLGTYPYTSINAERIEVDPSRREVRLRLADYCNERGHNLYWALDRNGPLTPEQSAAVLSISVVRVAAGMPAIAGVFLPWKREENTKSERYPVTWYRWAVGAPRHGWLSVDVGFASAWCHDVPDTWGEDADGWASPGAEGPETGDAGKLAADAAALDASFALLDDAGRVRALAPAESE